MRLILNPRRLISDLSSSKLDQNYETTLELDSHADTCVLGCDALILHDYMRPVRVQGYDPSLGTVQYNTVSGALAYTLILGRRITWLSTRRSTSLILTTTCSVQCNVMLMT